jgi:hypothetical protein
MGDGTWSIEYEIGRRESGVRGQRTEGSRQQAAGSRNNLEVRDQMWEVRVKAAL